MALKPCPDCGTEVSPGAEKCPKCGKRFKTSDITLIVTAIVVLLFVGFFMRECQVV